MLIQNGLLYHLDMIFIYENEYLFRYKGKATFWRPSWISGPKTLCSLHFKFGKHLQLFRQYDKVLKKYNQSCPPGGCNRGYYGILEYKCVESFTWLGSFVTSPCSQLSTILERCVVGHTTPDIKGRLGGSVRKLCILGK